MSSEWHTTTVGEICTKVFSGGTPTSTNANYYDGVIPWLRTKEVNYTKIFDTEKKITQLGLANSSAKIVPINSVIVAMYGNGDTAGRVAINKIPLTTNQACCNLIINPEIADFRYVYYYLMGQYHELVNLKNGGAQQNLNGQLIKEFPFSAPDVQEQQEIGCLLESVDDCITILRETNTTIEAMAQAIFKSWFVDFDPVHAKMEGHIPEGMDEATAALFPDSFVESELGLIPKGWKVKPIGEAIEVVGGATPDTKNPSYWEPAIHCWTTPKDLSGINSSVILDTERKLSNKGIAKIGSGLLPVGTLILSSRAPIGYLALTQVPMGINQGYIAIPPGGMLSPLYMLFWCRKNMDNIKSRANGSTFMEISKKAFRPIPSIIPSENVLSVFENLVGSLFESLVECEKEAQSLASLRDTLLPRLISGQLRIPESAESAPN